MPAPTVVAVGTYLTGTNSTTGAVPIPAGTAVDDVAVCMYYTEDISAAPGMPGGFTVLLRPVGGNHQLLVAWKRLTAADSGTYTFTTGGANWREGSCAILRGCVTTGDPFDVAAAASPGTGPTTPSVSLTTTAVDTLLWWAASNFAGGTWTMPGGWTSRVPGSDIGAASLVQAAAGATGGITGSSSGGAATSLATLVAFKGSNPSLTQTCYRWGVDDGTEAGHTFAAAESTAISTLGQGDNALLRIQVDETAGNATSLVPLVQYKRTDEPATEWRNLTT